ncbi:MAG: helix-hairpin-helix domain-containing protein [Candidatus Sedimenticola sp. (ex Thyasira tokunagai)]
MYGLYRALDIGFISTPAELYQLQQSQLSALERMGEKSASNLIQALAKSKATTLGRFLFVLGIREVGETTAQSLTRRYGDLVLARGAGSQYHCLYMCEI